MADKDKGIRIREHFCINDALKYIPRAVPLNKEEDMLKSAGFKEEHSLASFIAMRKVKTNTT